jgi:S-adenosyl methyltransferase
MREVGGTAGTAVMFACAKIVHSPSLRPADPVVTGKRVATAQGSWLVSFNEDWRKTFRPDIPSAARVYDYLLGGKDNYPADRAVAESLIEQLPNVRLAVQWNRAFLRRVVRYLVNEVGIRQIIDVGAGLPTVGNTHEIAQAASAAARVVYVDHDPVVLAHARAMLQGVPNTAIIEQDLLEPHKILADPALERLIDFGEPVAFLFLSILHFVADEDDPAGLIARLTDPFPAGTHVAISHATPDTVPAVRGAERVFDHATEKAHVRTRAEVLRLVAGLKTVEPGLTWPSEWRPDPGEVVPANAADAYYCVVVARKP